VRPLIYLDHNASAPVIPAAREAVARALDLVGNPSSQHAPGRAARLAVELARERLAAAVGAEPEEIVFTSGGTEACWMGVVGAAGAQTARTIITSATEHRAVLAACDALGVAGVRVVRLDVDRSGHLSPDVVAAALRGAKAPALVALHSANNETGVRLDIPAIASIAREHEAVCFTDAIQSLGKEPVDLGAWGVDLAAMSAHKVGGPKGVGALYVRRGTRLMGLVGGGGQERNRRAGTENVPGIAGFGAAAERLGERVRTMPGVRAMRDLLVLRLLESLPGIVVHGDPDSGLPNTLNIAVPGVDGDAMRVGLDLAGVAVSGGSACASGAVEPSHVLLAMGASEAQARGALRLSLGPGTTADDAERAAAEIARLAVRIRA
jgi:cysteine desulfurase